MKGITRPATAAVRSTSRTGSADRVRSSSGSAPAPSSLPAEGASVAAAVAEGSALAAGDGSSVPLAYRSAKRTGVKVSLRALSTPCAPTVMTPQVTSRQSMVREPPERSKASKTAPGTVSRTLQVPSPLIVPLAEPAVSEPGKATKRWKPWLSADSLSGT